MTVFLSRIVFATVRASGSRCFSVNCFTELVSQKNQILFAKNDLFAVVRQQICRNYSSDTIESVAPLESSSIRLKKKSLYKKPDVHDLTTKEGHYLTLAYATANTYDLKGLKEALLQQKLYEPGKLKAQEVGDVVVANAVYSVGDEPREIIFFKEGAVVFWNCTELEASNVLDFIRLFEQESYPRDVVEREKEIMSYVYQPTAKKCYLQESCFVLVPDRDNSLERYTFSHAMAQSARLGAWEARLESLAASVRAHTAAMEKEGAAHVDKKAVIRKLGELFSLRHTLNVESDLLDTPDFYWEEARLEKLYSNTVAYFTIPRRTRVLNERLSHCVELLELLSGWAADRHHVRLEWMVIALILAEVCFELLHCFERYVVGERTRYQFQLESRQLPRYASDFEENYQDLPYTESALQSIPAGSQVLQQ